MNQVQRFLQVISACLIVATVHTAWAWPDKPIKIVVIANAGGFPDIAARTIAPHLSRALGQQVLVENRPGAGGNIATHAVAKAAPDGHTLLLTGNNHAVNQTLLPNPGFDYKTGLASISMLAETSIVLISRPSFEANDFAGIASLAKKDPKALSIAVTAIGTPGHLAAELYTKLSGLDPILVPYTGIAPALTDVMSGQVQMAFASLTGTAGLISGGRLKALAVAGSKRSVFAPQIPSSTEAGLAGFDVKSWVCLMTTGGTPTEVVRRLNAEVRTILALPEVQESFKAQGTEIWATTPDELDSILVQEAQRWANTLKNAKLR
jgi:tripartite-type tricarboxylate transporter receptor subunit TctC